ncbi:MAG: hypothetical protein IT250_01150, partial [Chitinophagaceae bacterium]|nr:hypothetical protein [Chitinophagaceae bacterium]
LDIENLQLAICAAHNHSAPSIGNLIAHYNNPLKEWELAATALYADELRSKLIEVALKAYKNREECSISVAYGEVDFAVNRRLHLNPDGRTDHSLPVMRILNKKGDTKAVIVNYACHAVTHGPENNYVHGDWVGEAKIQIEQHHPGAIAMVTIGCGADQNSSPRMNTKNPELNFEYTFNQGKKIADEVERLINNKHPWKNIDNSPKGNLIFRTLSFANKPNIRKLANDASGNGRTANYSKLILDRMARNELDMDFQYPIQVWNFGNDYSMIFLGGEVVVDYGLILKSILGKENVWINGYSNDIQCYIPTRQVLNEGGYEAWGAMIGYERPSSLKPEVEETVLQGVLDLLPEKIKKQLILRNGSDGRITLPSKRGKATGPNIKYMPEWEAFGWFRSDDRVEWNVDVLKSGVYEVYIDWSVSDEEAGKKFIIEANGSSLQNKVPKSGGWEKYKQQHVGKMTLKPGKQFVTFRPHGSFDKDKALLDLRGLTFIPVK